MLFKLSIKNIKKSFKDYAIYFFTLILGVAIFYVFNALDSQTVMLDVSKSTHDLIDLMNQVLSGVSVFVSFILGFLIIYASRFLMKRRKQEFGIYMTLGMSKGKISKILLMETLLIGLVSLGAGLILGICLSQLMSVLVANMFEADMTKFTFTFSSGSMIKTCIYFGIMYLLVMIFNTFSVSKCKLIDLLNAKKKSETVKLKNPILCVVVFIIAVAMLSYAYYNVTVGVNNLQYFSDILFQMALGAIGTFLIFWSLSGLILRLVQSMKRVYLKGLNLFTIRQINSKINTTVFSMTVICLMLFLTICIFSSALSLKNSMSANLKELVPIDIEFYKPLNARETYHMVVNDSENEDSKVSIWDTLEKYNLDIKDDLKDITELTSYQQADLTFAKTLGNTLDEVKKDYPFLLVDSKEEIVKLSDYNRVAKLYDNPTYTLEDDEYLILADYDSMVELRNKALEENTIITINGKEYHPKYKECQDGFIDIATNHINAGIIVVPDKAVENLIEAKAYVLANYKADTKEGKREVEDKINALEQNYPNIDQETLLSASSKISLYDASIGLSAMATFIGLYLGLIFLMASAAILALKELSESSDNKENFIALRKIGVDEKMLNRALFNQIAIFFALPLILAIIHSIFGIQVCNYILETFGNEKLLLSIVMTACFLGVIYGGYFLITYFCSKNIIKE
mgnify:FL=1